MCFHCMQLQVSSQTMTSALRFPKSQLWSSKVWEVQILWKVTSCLHRNSLLPFVFSFHLKASKACAVVSAAKALYSYIPGYWDVIPKPSSPKTLYGKLIMIHTYYWQREKFLRVCSNFQLLTADLVKKAFYFLFPSRYKKCFDSIFLYKFCLK